MSACSVLKFNYIHLHCTENQFRERGLIINFHRIFRGVVCSTLSFKRFGFTSENLSFQNPGAMEKGAKPISVFLWKSELPREALKQAEKGRSVSGGSKNKSHPDCLTESLNFL